MRSRVISKLEPKTCMNWPGGGNLSVYPKVIKKSSVTRSMTKLWTLINQIMRLKRMVFPVNSKSCETSIQTYQRNRTKIITSVLVTTGISLNQFWQRKTASCSEFLGCPNFLLHCRSTDERLAGRVYSVGYNSIYCERHRRLRET